MAPAGRWAAGFGGTNTEGRVSLGLARVDGPYSSFTTRSAYEEEAGFQ